MFNIVCLYIYTYIYFPLFCLKSMGIICSRIAFPSTAYGEVEQPDIAETPASKHQMAFAERREAMPESSGAALLACGEKEDASSFSRLFLSAFNKWKEGWGWGWEDAANVLVWVFLQYVLKSSTEPRRRYSIFNPSSR